MNGELNQMNMTLARLEVWSFMEIIKQYNLKDNYVSGVMFWSGIFGSEIIHPFKVVDGIMINLGNYCLFLDKMVIIKH